MYCTNNQSFASPEKFQNLELDWSKPSICMPAFLFILQHKDVHGETEAIHGVLNTNGAPIINFVSGDLLTITMVFAVIGFNLDEKKTFGKARICVFL